MDLENRQVRQDDRWEHWRQNAYEEIRDWDDLGHLLEGDHDVLVLEHLVVGRDEA